MEYRDRLLNKLERAFQIVQNSVFIVVANHEYKKKDKIKNFEIGGKFYLHNTA